MRDSGRTDKRERGRVRGTGRQEGVGYICIKYLLKALTLAKHYNPESPSALNLN